MRIAIDYSSAVNQRAGIGRLVRSQVMALAEFDHETEYVLLHARPDAGTEPIFPSAANFSRRQVALQERWLTILWHRARVPLAADVLAGRVDLFHSPDFVLPPLKRARGIVTVHDLAFLMRPECADHRLRSYLEVVVPRSVSQADFVVADSENTRNDLVVLLGVSPGRIEVVPGGVDARFTPIEDSAALQDARALLGVGDSAFILSVGVIEPRKNLNLLMDAFAMLKQSGRFPAHKLVLAGGKGWLADGIFEHRAQSPVAADILMPGFIPDSGLPAAYSAAEVLAFPSLYEGFGLPILEAMACGTPVVSSNSSCLPEVAEGAAVMINPEDVQTLADGLEQVLSDSALRADLREKGLRRAGGYTWRVAAERLHGVYQRVYQGA